MEEGWGSSRKGSRPSSSGGARATAAPKANIDGFTFTDKDRQEHGERMMRAARMAQESGREQAEYFERMNASHYGLVGDMTSTADQMIRSGSTGRMRRMSLSTATTILLSQ